MIRCSSVTSLQVAEVLFDLLGRPTPHLAGIPRYY